VLVITLLSGVSVMAAEGVNVGPMNVVVKGNEGDVQSPVSLYVANTSGFDVAFTIKPTKGGSCQNVINSWGGYKRVASMGRVVVKSGSSVYLDVVNSLSEVECKVLGVIGSSKEENVGDTFTLDRLQLNSYMTVTFSIEGIAAPQKGRFELYENSSYIVPNAWWHWMCNKLDQNAPRCVKNLRLDVTKNSWF